MVGRHPIVDGPCLQSHSVRHLSCHYFARLAAAHDECAAVYVEVDGLINPVGNVIRHNYVDGYVIDRPRFDSRGELIDFRTQHRDE